MRILVVEDDREASRYLKKGLTESGYNVTVTADGDEGLVLASGGGFDCLIIDRMLPGMDGLEIVEALREKGDDTPVLVLSALDKVKDRVAGLKRGSDDYLVKPFAFSELLARIEALLRRANPRQVETQLKVGDLELELRPYTDTPPEDSGKKINPDLKSLYTEANPGAGGGEFITDADL